MDSTLTRMPIATYSLVLTAVECEGQTIYYKLRMRWRRSRPAWRQYRKTWKYKVLENALRKILTLTAAHGKPKTLNIMGYLAQYEGTSLTDKPNEE